MGKVKDLKGQRFGRLTVIEFAGTDKHRNKIWKCECDCGNIKNVSGRHLSKGNIKSCGCLSREIKLRDLGKLSDGFLKYSIDNTNVSTLNKKRTKTNISGSNGVTFYKSRSKWVAGITIQGKRIFLGYFDKLEDAVSARKKAEEIYFQPIIDKFNALNK